MIYVFVAIAILFISFIIALISLVREQKEISHGHIKEEEAVSVQGNQEEKIESVDSNDFKDKFDDHAKLRASHLETMFGKEEKISSTADYEPFPWEQENNFRGIVPKKEEDQSYPENPPATSSLPEQKLSGVINLKDIPQKS